jgi:hypothetical protein
MVEINGSPEGSTYVRQRTSHDVLRTRNTRDPGSSNLPRDYSRMVTWAVIWAQPEVRRRAQILRVWGA